MQWTEIRHIIFFRNRTIKLSLGLNNRMTFWGLEGKHIPSIIKSKNIQYQEALFILDSAPTQPPCKPHHDPR